MTYVDRLCKNCASPVTSAKAFALYCSPQCGRRARSNARKTQRRAICMACGTAWSYSGHGYLKKVCPDCVATHRWCGRCKRALPLDAFLQSTEIRCRDCRRERAQQQRKYHGRRPLKTDTARRAKLRNKYGMTLEQFDESAEKQGHRCAICARTVILVVDHDHSGPRKSFRGLLCRNCNAGLGMFRDDPDSLLAAAAYVLASQDVLALPPKAETHA